MTDSKGDPGGKSDEPTLFNQPESSARSGEDRSNESGRQWPPQDRFPLNLERPERRVESTVQKLYDDSSKLLAALMAACTSPSEPGTSHRVAVAQFSHELEATCRHGGKHGVDGRGQQRGNPHIGPHVRTYRCANRALNTNGRYQNAPIPRHYAGFSH